MNLICKLLRSLGVSKTTLHKLRLLTHTQHVHHRTFQIIVSFVKKGDLTTREYLFKETSSRGSKKDSVLVSTREYLRDGFVKMSLSKVTLLVYPELLPDLFTKLVDKAEIEPLDLYLDLLRADPPTNESVCHIFCRHILGRLPENWCVVKNTQTDKTNIEPEPETEPTPQTPQLDLVSA